jgi:hypothetical protein
VTTTPAGTSAWAAYLDAVEAAARHLTRQVLDPAADAGALAEAVPALVPQPPGPWPAALEPRRRQVLAALTEAAATAERRRDAARAQLDALARPVPRPRTAGYADGATLDVLG